MRSLVDQVGSVANAIIVCIAAVGCEPQPSALFDAGQGNPPEDDAGVSDAGPPPDACPDDACPSACAAPIAGLCILPGTDILEGASFAVSILTNVCLGASCTSTVDPICHVEVDGADIQLSGVSCWYADGTDGCSEDCSGADGARCEIPALDAGAYTIHVDGRALPLTVPMSTTSDALCVHPE